LAFFALLAFNFFFAFRFFSMLAAVITALYTAQAQARNIGLDCCRCSHTVSTFLLNESIPYVSSFLFLFLPRLAFSLRLDELLFFGFFPVALPLLPLPVIVGAAAVTFVPPAPPDEGRVCNNSNVWPS
jgi:hypothetical protein